MNTGILITGASGFIGRYTIQEFSRKNSSFIIYALVRRITNFPPNVIQILCADIASIDDVDIPWKQIGTVIHLAARAHVLREEIIDPLTEFRRINRDATEKLATKCGAAGVSRFIFLSSIGVLGNTSRSAPLNEETVERPHADYAISKLEAEQALKVICKKYSMNYVIVRPPLVIGKDAPGNFNLLLKLVKKNIPLPFRLVANKRSFIFCKNLANFIYVCATNDKANNEVFLISDEPSMSTPELIQNLASGLGKKTYFFPVPLWILKLLANIFSRKNTYIQLCESLEIDSSKAKHLLNWQPPYPLKESLQHIFDK